MLIAEVMTGLNPRNWPHLSASSVMMNQPHLTGEEAPMAGGTMDALHISDHAPRCCSQVHRGAWDEAEAESRQPYY